MDEAENNQGRSAIEYIKENHSWIIACASGIIAVLLFLAGSFAYICQKITLQEYKIPAEYIDITKHGQVFYSVIASFGYYLIVGLVQLQIVRILKNYYVYSALKTYSDVYYDKHDRKNVERELSLLKETKKEQKKKAVIKIFFLLLGLFVSYLIFIQVISTVRIETLLFGLAITVLVFFLARSGAKKEARESDPRKAKKNIASIYSETDEEAKAQKSDRYYDNALIRALQIGTERRSVEEALLEHAVTAGVSIILTFVAVTGSAFVEARTKDTYPIYSGNDKQYVLVYQNTEVRVLEEAIIDEDSLTILLSNQRYLSSDDIELKVQKFQEVKKIEERHITSDKNPSSEETEQKGEK